MTVETFPVSTIIYNLLLVFMGFISGFFMSINLFYKR